MDLLCDLFRRVYIINSMNNRTTMNANFHLTAKLATFLTLPARSLG